LQTKTQKVEENKTPNSEEVSGNYRPDQSNFIYGLYYFVVSRLKGTESKRGIHYIV